ncbi:MAG TPA: hypothetical protein IAB65_06065 [Candidatus Onthocola stercorigallinarum]|nr:hypothetical protein [Candidatus Onthocola stercorigallinarum]
MVEEKKKVLSSILNGKIKVSKSLEEYKNVVNDIKNIDYQSNLNVKFEQFQIALYNYSRAITDQKKYFELSGKIEKIFNKIIIPNSDEYSSRKYTFFDLYRAFRNRNEHYDKINCETEYIIFKTSILKDVFFRLYEVCNEVLDYELNKLTYEEIISFLLSNIEIKTNYEKVKIALRKSNEENKDKNPNIYNEIKNLLKDFSGIDLDNITIEQLDYICNKFKSYILSENYKKEFVNRYGINLYEELLKIYNDDFSLEMDKYIINDFFQKIYLIEKQNNNNND